MSLVPKQVKNEARFATLELLRETCEDIKNDDDIWVVIFTGTGLKNRADLNESYEGGISNTLKTTVAGKT